jgi:hypothetical protein
LPDSNIQRALIVLACGAGETNTSISKRRGSTVMNVRKWRKWFRELETWRAYMTNYGQAGFAPMKTTP